MRGPTLCHGQVGTDHAVEVDSSDSNAQSTSTNARDAAPRNTVSRGPAACSVAMEALVLAAAPPPVPLDRDTRTTGRLVAGDEALDESPRGFTHTNHGCSRLGKGRRLRTASCSRDRHPEWIAGTREGRAREPAPPPPATSFCHLPAVPSARSSSPKTRGQSQPQSLRGRSIQHRCVAGWSRSPTSHPHPPPPLAQGAARLELKLAHDPGPLMSHPSGRPPARPPVRLSLANYLLGARVGFRGSERQPYLTSSSQQQPAPRL